MSAPAPVLPAAPPSTVLPRDEVDAFIARERTRIETALAEAFPLVRGGPLEAVRSPLELALGIRGPRGRRWRPLMTLAAARACGGWVDAALPAAVAVELTHTASLVLDDLPCMDDAPDRRGVPSTHRLLGSAGAILVAVSLLGRAAELLGACPRGAALAAEWGRCFGLEGMSGGQAVDVTARKGLAGEARRLHRRKTTALSAFALAAGARVAGAGPDVRRGLERFGEEVGWAYQLADDARDLAEDASLGRPTAEGPPLLPRSRRHLARALTRLDRMDLRPDGAALLHALGRQVVLGARHERDPEAC